jgi:cytochrome c biogenesis protein CcdA
MTDVAGWTFDMAARHATYAPAGAFALGVVSGLGPCALARGAALASLTADATATRVAVSLGSYAAGAAAGYVAYGTIATFAFRAAAWSSYSYACLAVVLLATGLRSILHCHDHHHENRRARSIGGALVLGFGGSIVLSPCCTPFVFALIASAAADARYAAWLLLCFAFGHVAPAALIAAGARCGRRLSGVRPNITSFASGTISLAMAAYYGLLI